MSYARREQGCLSKLLIMNHNKLDISIQSTRAERNYESFHFERPLKMGRTIDKGNAVFKHVSELQAEG